MSRYFDQLLSIASRSITDAEPILDDGLLSLGVPLGYQLIEMLRRKNGFYAFESALHVFPSDSSHDEVGLAEWNDGALWRNEYEGYDDGCLFFAEDAFGGQFCIKSSKIYTFDPETGALAYLADKYFNRIL